MKKVFGKQNKTAKPILAMLISALIIMTLIPAVSAANLYTEESLSGAAKLIDLDFST